MTEVTLTLNGRERRTSVPEGATLAELLREQVGLTGTKIACAEGTCGACTVLVDGRGVLSCILRAEQAEGSDVTTIEGLGDEGALSPLQRAFVEEDALQCGFCTSGMVLSCQRLLDRNPKPSRPEIREAISGNLCRCGTYNHVFDAVERTAGLRKAEVPHPAAFLTSELSSLDSRLSSLDSRLSSDPRVGPATLEAIEEEA